MPTAIFYDLENFKSAFTSCSIETTIKRIEKLIDESPLSDDIVLRQAFFSSNNKFFNYNIHVLEKFGIEAIKVEMPCKKENVTNMVDFKMNVYIADYVARIRKVKTIILATGDGDFAFLCELIKSKDKKLIILSDSTQTNRGLIKLCDDWIDCNDSYNYRKISIRNIFKDRLPEIDTERINIEKAINRFAYTVTKDNLLKKLIIKRRVTMELFLEIAGEYIDFTSYNNLKEQELMDIINYLLLETELEVIRIGKTMYIGYNAQILEDNKDKYKYLYNRLINKTPDYDKYKMLNWYSYFKQNKSYIKEMLYYSSMVQHVDDMLNDQESSDIKIRVSDLDKKKIAHWKRNIEKENLSVSEMFYYYEFLTKNKIIYEEKNKYRFVGKTKYKNTIVEKLTHQLDELKLTVNETEIKRLKRKL